MHEKKVRNTSGDIDIEAEMKKKFGFNVKAHAHLNTLKEERKLGLFKKNKLGKEKGPIVNVKNNKKIISQNENFNGNRSSLFYNKFIRKQFSKKNVTNSKSKLDPKTIKKKLERRRIMTNFERRGMRGSKNDDDIPDFFKLNKLISNNNENLIDLSDKKYEKKLEVYKKEQLKNRKLPNLKKSKINHRRLKTSFNYTKIVKDRKRMEEQNDENIINLKSRADILVGYEKEMMKDLSEGKEPEQPSLVISHPEKEKTNAVIGRVTRVDSDLFKNVLESSPNESMSKLQPRFQSFSMQIQEGTSREAGKEEKKDAEESTKFLQPEESEVNLFSTLEKEKKEEKELFEFENQLFTLKKPNKKLDEVVFEICSNDWENNVFGKHTPTKDFLKNEVAPNINT